MVPTPAPVSAPSPHSIWAIRKSVARPLGSKAYDISKLAVPSFGNRGPSQPPFYIRTPGRSNFDISFFKNFNITEEKKIQFRTGLFNVFNQAYPTQINVTSTNPNDSDIFLALDTECDPANMVRRPTGDGTNQAAVCDPTKRSGSPKTLSTTSVRSRTSAAVA